MLLIMRNERESERKPLSFSTTMRNPNRIAGFLRCALPYENQILTHEVIMSIVSNVLKAKIYKPTSISRNASQKAIFEADDETFSDKMIAAIIEENPQQHKERGFEKGWESRFDTWFKLPKEFGFINYEKDKVLKITNVGHMLIDALNEPEANAKKVQSVMLNSMLKYRSDNPFRKNLNSNFPFILLLQVLNYLKNDPEENGAGISLNEISFLICWPDDNSLNAYKFIKKFRTKYKYSASVESIYEECLKLLGADDSQRNRFKMSQITGEAIDEYIRKMRSTGILSLRGNGRFLDFNSFETDKINYILDNYSNQPKYDSSDDYISYIGDIDPNILIDEEVELSVIDKKRQETLVKLSNEYSKEQIYNELLFLQKNKESSDPLFKYIPNAARLEFLTSIALIQNLDNISVYPCYPIDDEGLPTSTGGGGKADIVCHDLVDNANFEVTLMHGRSNQINNEIIPIRRHLIELKGKKFNAFAVFIAPNIHEDVYQASKLYKSLENLDIIPYNISEFVQLCQTINKLGEFNNDAIIIHRV